MRRSLDFLRLGLLVAVVAAGCAGPAPHAAARSARDDGKNDGKHPKPAKKDDTPTARVVEVALEDLGREDPGPRSPFAAESHNFRAELLHLRELASDADVAAVRLKPNHSLDSARTLDVLKELRGI